MYEIVDVKEVASTKWLRLNTTQYKDKTGKIRAWDFVERTTTAKESTADAVAIFAVLKDGSDEPKTILVKQFRPPVGRCTVELPAGLIDPGESAEVAATRELKEETGYTSKILRTSPAVCMSPGMTKEMIQIVHVEVDMTSAENRHPVQTLGDDENIEVFVVPTRGLRQYLDEQTRAGCSVFIGLYMLALGLETAEEATSNNKKV